MIPPSQESIPAHPYLLGHSDREIGRLERQAGIVDPITRRFFQEAGVAPGMRVLDVGSGGGDVSLLVADLVGDRGQVVGVDRSPMAVEAAAARIQTLGRSNVSFDVGDPADMSFDRSFDAVVGRYVLQFQKDATPMLRKLAALTRPGGLVAFHELDWHGVESFPPASLFERCRSWGIETLRRHGTEFRMGMKLYATFAAAGLPSAEVRVVPIVGYGASAATIAQFMGDFILTLAPEIERLEVATAAEVGAETLIARLVQEAEESSSFFSVWTQFGVWSRV